MTASNSAMEPSDHPLDGAAASGDIAKVDVFADNEAGGTRLPDDELLTILEHLLESRPGANVVAIGANGLFLPMPDEVPLRGQSVITGHMSALELVIAADMKPIIEIWKLVLTQGATRMQVHPVENAELSMELYFVDVRATYGVIIGVIVPPEGGHLGSVGGVRNLLRPRVSSIRKNNLSEFIELDSAFEQILGHSREDLIGRRNLEFVHPDDHTRAIANWMDLLASPGSSRQVRLRQLHRDGHWLWFEITNHNHLDDPEDPCVVTEMIDISEEMAAQEYLRASEQLLRRLTESLPVGVLQIDVDGKVIHRNAGVSQILHAQDTGTFDEAFSEVDPADRVELTAAVNRATTDGSDTDLELTVRAPDDLRRCKVSLRALIGENKEPTGVLICIDDVTEAARLREQLRDRATFDALTRCYNRAATLAALDRALVEAKSGDSGVAVIFIDLDGFKAVNDRRGHSEGDALLQRVAACLNNALRPHDLVGRFGGDEFVAIGTGVHSADEALAMGNRLAAALVKHISPEPPSRSVASIGVAFSDGEIGADVLINHADGAMYLSKREGVGRPMMLGMSVESKAS